MNERAQRSAWVSVLVTASIGLMCAAYLRPAYFTNELFIGGLLFLEILAVAVWMYTRLYFPFSIVSFLLAGMSVPGVGFWRAERWVALGLGAFVGCIILLKRRTLQLNRFHAVALVCAVSGLASAMGSQQPRVALLKALSLVLLFVYAATGPRLSAIGNEYRFLDKLLIAIEVFVGSVAAFHFIGVELLGSSNSLGAVMCMAAPLISWGCFATGDRVIFRRRVFLFLLCVYMIFSSHARASIAAALLSCGILCFALRRYKLMIAGLITLVIMVATASIFWPDSVSSLTTGLVYKTNSAAQTTSLFESRTNPWRAAIDNIKQNPWFGMGLGTTANMPGFETQEPLFASTAGVTAENGCSYLSIVVGVGLLGAVPFMLLIGVLLTVAVRTVTWMRVSGSPMNPAIPLAMFILAAIVHALFEDWMFAPGNYLCVFFWCMAFLLADFAPSLRLSGIRGATQ